MSRAATRSLFLSLLNSELVPQGHLVALKVGSERLGYWDMVFHN